MMHDLLTFAEAHWGTLTAIGAAAMTHVDRIYAMLGQQGGLKGIYSVIMNGDSQASPQPKQQIAAGTVGSGRQ